LLHSIRRNSSLSLNGLDSPCMSQSPSRRDILEHLTAEERSSESSPSSSAFSTRPFSSTYLSGSNSNSMVDIEKLNDDYDNWRGDERDEDKNIDMNRIQNMKNIHNMEVKKNNNVPRGKKKKGRRVTMKMGQEIRNMMKDLTDQSMGGSDDTNDVTTEQEDEEEMLLYVDGIDHDLPDIDFKYNNNGDIEWIDQFNAENENSLPHNTEKVENGEVNEEEKGKEIEREKKIGGNAYGILNKREIDDDKQSGQGQVEGGGGRGGIGNDSNTRDRDNNCSVAEGLFRLVTADWMEEFKSVWKMQCVLR
jgi:hypothetical protein